MIKTAFSSMALFDRTIRDVAEMAANLGYDGVELQCAEGGHLDNEMSLSEIHRITVLNIILSIPNSGDLIDYLLSRRNDKHSLEIIFSLFCCLDDYVITCKIEERNSMLSSIHDFLLNINIDSAHAAWKAGETLGAHWPLKESLPILIKVVKKAKYAVGREAAIYGLNMALKNDKLNNENRKYIISLLNDTSQKDKSYKVRSTAKYTLSKRKILKK